MRPRIKRALYINICATVIRSNTYKVYIIKHTNVSLHLLSISLTQCIYSELHLFFTTDPELKYVKPGCYCRGEWGEGLRGRDKCFTAVSVFACTSLYPDYPVHDNSRSLIHYTEPCKRVLLVVLPLSYIRNLQRIRV